jgi:anaerobic magnesium-protoporphyrin IX monomethyl ester cyclase
MRVLLVGPEREENLSLRYLAASLHAAGHEADLARFDGLEDLSGVLRLAANYDAIGLSMCFQASPEVTTPPAQPPNC